jgi:hypothetical protein
MGASYYLLSAAELAVDFFMENSYSFSWSAKFTGATETIMGTIFSQRFCFRAAGWRNVYFDLTKL